MLEVQDTKLKKSIKLELILAFFIFAFLIIITTTYSAIYFSNNILSKEFKDKVILASNTLYYIYSKEKQKIKNIATALSKSELINNHFNINPSIIKPILQIIISSNKDIKEINIYNKNLIIVGCNKKSCYFYKVKKKSKDEIIKKDKIIFTYIAKDKREVEVKGEIKLWLFKNNFFNIILMSPDGKIYFSKFKTKSIFDIFNHRLAKKIIKKEGFISDDIFVKKFSKNLKVVFLQDKSVIEKTNSLTKQLALILIFVSLLIAIPLGIIFSKPLYNFYEELDKRVKEEIEKRREKEQLLMHQSKLAALGEMLGNIAHQWRHPITRLSLLLQQLEMAFMTNKLNKEKFEKIKNQAMMQINYMSDTIDDFTNFFKKDTKKSEFKVSQIIEDVLKLLEGRLKNIEVSVEIKKDKKLIGYKSEFSQVILNIINNAIDVLTEREIKNKKITITIDEKITICDNGGGVDEKIIDKIFEPYFTTKFQSQGTGIGLYMSRVIITQRFNGKIYVKNNKNGACFFIEV